MTTLFISDLHLNEDNAALTELFLNFLYEYAPRAQALYILGDLFEFWIGDDYLLPFHRQIISALHEVTSTQIPIYFMHGNRDFLIGRHFLKKTGMTLLKDYTRIDLHGEPVLLTHGDLLCVQDKDYQRYRRITHNWFIKRWFLSKSIQERLKIAENFRAESRSLNSQKSYDLMDVSMPFVEKIMHKYGVQQLVHGHTHHPAIHHHSFNQKPATRIVLGPWETHGYVLTCDPKPSKGLIWEQHTLL